MGDNFLHHYDGPASISRSQAFDASSNHGGVSEHLSHLQKEFLRNEYLRQQEELARKKVDNVREKEIAFDKAQQDKLEYDNHLAREKQSAVDKKRIIAEHNRLQIEQASRDKALKKQQQLDEDKARLRASEENHRWDMEQKLQHKQHIRQQMTNNLNQKPAAERRVPNGDDSYQLGMQFGSENVQKRQQLERFEQIHQSNQRNFISFEDEKQRKAEVFSRQGQSNPAINYQQQQQKRTPLYESNSGLTPNDKREHNEALKRQIAENQLRKEQERQDRIQSSPYVVNPSERVAQENADVLNKKQEQQKYREYLNQQQQLKQAESSRESQQYRPAYDEQYQQQQQQQQQREQYGYQQQQKQQQAGQSVEYDIMGNVRQVHSTGNINSRGGTGGVAAADQKREDQQRYRQILQQQLDQNRQIKQHDDDEMNAMDQRFQGLGIGQGQQQQQQQRRVEENKQTGSYNPVTNQLNVNNYQRNNKGGAEEEGGTYSRGGNGNNRVDYKALANKNFLGHDY